MVRASSLGAASVPGGAREPWCRQAAGVFDFSGTAQIAGTFDCKAQHGHPPQQQQCSGVVMENVRISGAKEGYTCKGYTMHGTRDTEP